MDAYARQRERYQAMRREEAVAAAVSQEAEERENALLAARFCVNMSYERQQSLDPAQWVGVDVEHQGRVGYCVNEEADVPEVKRRRVAVHAVQTRMCSVGGGVNPPTEHILQIRCSADVEPRTAWVTHALYDSVPCAVVVLAPVNGVLPLPVEYAVTLMPSDACEEGEVLLPEDGSSTWLRAEIHVSMTVRADLPAVAAIVTPSGDAIAEWLAEVPGPEPALVRLQAAVQRASDTSATLNEGDRIWLSERHWFVAGRLFESGGRRLLAGTLRATHSCEVEITVATNPTEYADLLFIPGVEDIVPAPSFQAALSTFRSVKLPAMHAAAARIGASLDELCVLGQTMSAETFQEALLIDKFM